MVWFHTSCMVWYHGGNGSSMDEILVDSLMRQELHYIIIITQCYGMYGSIPTINSDRDSSPTPPHILIVYM